MKKFESKIFFRNQKVYGDENKPEKISQITQRE